jgi:predicted nuclease of restriction endonuclease-like (RecB) superfamily
MSDSGSIIPRDYAGWLASLKSHISCARQRATLAVNQELVRLYHHIGTEILERQTRQGWGAKVIDRLAADLRAAFPEMKGFSSSNLKYMRFFAEKCPAGLIGQQPADQLPWFHLVTLLTKVSANTEREWYAAQVIQHGWSRPTLVVHIKNRLHLRQGVAITNFDRHLPTPHAQLAIEALKDPYLGVAFKPEHAGQLNFYLAAVDAQIKAPDDKPTIGLLLCKTKNRLVAEYALSGISKPIGVAEYQLVRALPEPLDTHLPSIEEIEAELSREEDER